MAINIEYTDEFGRWWLNLTVSQQNDVAIVVMLLEERGVSLGFPYSSKINGSRHSGMRELRIQSQGNPIRIFYMFDPRRTAILLIGGDKTGDGRFYERFIPIVDKLYNIYLEEIKREGLI